MNYISTTQFKTDYPDVDVSRYDDATLSGIITKASKRVDQFTEFSFNQETITDELVEGYVDEDANLVIMPRKRPVTSLTSVAIVKGTVSVDLTITSGGSNIYNIPQAGDTILIPSNDIEYTSTTLLDLQSLRNTKFFTKITYQAGYATIPVDVQEATALFALDYVARRTNLSGAVSVSQGGISINYGSGSKGKSDFVKDAESLLIKYKRVSGW